MVMVMVVVVVVCVFVCGCVCVCVVEAPAGDELCVFRSSPKRIEVFCERLGM